MRPRRLRSDGRSRRKLKRSALKLDLTPPTTADTASVCASGVDRKDGAFSKAAIVNMIDKNLAAK